MTGDGFGGRGWYKAHNYQVGAYSAYTVCGDSNQLYAWGDNGRGELGNGTLNPTIAPVAVTGMTHVKFYTSGYYSAVIKTDKTAWAWSLESMWPNASLPRDVLDNVKFVDGGSKHIVFVKEDGTVWGLGSNINGELGNGTTSANPIWVPVQMTGINSAVRAIAAATPNSTIILLSDGTVKIAGGGYPFPTTNSSVPITLAGLSNIVDLKGNAVVAYALDKNGEVYSFGRDFTSSPVLGLGDPTGIPTPPTKVTFPQGSASIVALSSNNDGYSCLALDSNQNVYGWGNNEFGQLGDGTFNSITTPKLIATNAIDIFAGENFSYILKADGTLWASGQSGYDNINYGSIWMNLPNIQRNVFTQIDPTIAPMNLCAPKVWGVVPIKLSNFTCVADNSNAILNWQSAEERNASKYIVEYSNDGRNFQSIATLIAKGSNSAYTYSHYNVTGTAFYRLKMIDKDGSYTYSEIRVVSFNGKAGITIAPNPANDAVYIFTKGIVKSVQVFSVDGQLLKSISNHNNGQSINISNLAASTYIMKTVSSNNETHYARFVKK